MSKIVTYVEIDVPTFLPQSPEATETFRFAVPAAYLPGDIDAIASIESVSFTPATISLGENLGQRASLTITFNDHLHIFAGEPYDQGTFWGKWRGRHGTRLRGCPLRLIRGEVGQALSAMDTRHYVVEVTGGPTPGAMYTIEAKDILKLADDDRAQAPALSNGSLAGSISAIAGSLSLSPTGIGAAEYPTSGWVCIGGKEVVSFTRVGDTLTIVRGQFGTVASTHNAGDRVQLVLRYTGNDPADIIQDLLVNYAGVPSDYIPITDWQLETSTYLNVIYAATITEPTSVNKLVSELIEQAALAVWWDDRARLVRLLVLREIATDTDTFDEDRILEGSLSVSEQPSKRISQIWTYYGQRDPTDSGANEDGYRATLATVDLAREDSYGSAEIKKIQARWVETETAANRLNSLQISRFRDPPRAFAFELTREETITLGAGYQLRWWANQDETGQGVPALIQITKMTIHPDRIHVEAEEMLASGTVVLVNVVFLTMTGSVLGFSVPATWNSSDNTVEIVGAGGGGDKNSGAGAQGGGAGAYSRVTNLALTPLATAQYRVGSPGQGGNGGSATDGGDSWFNGASFGAASVAAKGGMAGDGRAGAGQGGQASAGIGTVKRSGGDGGNGAPKGESRAGGGGGAGAGGPHGNGADGASLGSNGQDGGGGGGGADDGDGGNSSSGATGGDGGNNRFNFGGGVLSNPNGDEGGGGRGGDTGEPGGIGGDGEQLWTQTVAPITSAGPGGGGAGGGSGAPGGDGGDYGGGGGGSGDGGGSGGDGGGAIIILMWREV